MVKTANMDESKRLVKGSITADGPVVTRPEDIIMNEVGEYEFHGAIMELRDTAI